MEIHEHEHVTRHTDFDGYGLKATFIDGQLTRLEMRASRQHDLDAQTFIINRHPYEFLEALDELVRLED
jgi:hypothetical protein